MFLLHINSSHMISILSFCEKTLIICEELNGCKYKNSTSKVILAGGNICIDCMPMSL